MPQFLGIIVLIGILLSVFNSDTISKIIGKESGFIGVIYLVWAIGNFFEAKKIGSYVKALFSFLLGTLTFYIIIFTIGITIDILTKH